MGRVSMLRERFFPSVLMHNGWLQLALYLWHSRQSKLLVQQNPELYEEETLTLRDGAEVSLEWHQHSTASRDSPLGAGGGGGGATAAVSAHSVAGRTNVAAATAERQLVVLLNPTLTGAAADFNMVDVAKAITESGVTAVVFHRRGHSHRSPSGKRLRTPRFHMFGSTDDLQQVIEHIEGRVPGCAVALVGYVCVAHGVTTVYWSKTN